MHKLPTLMLVPTLIISTAIMIAVAAHADYDDDQIAIVSCSAQNLIITAVTPDHLGTNTCAILEDCAPCIQTFIDAYDCRIKDVGTSQQHILYTLKSCELPPPA